MGRRVERSSAVNRSKTVVPLPATPVTASKKKARASKTAIETQQTERQAQSLDVPATSNSSRKRRQSDRQLEKHVSPKKLPPIDNRLIQASEHGTDDLPPKKRTRTQNSASAAKNNASAKTSGKKSVAPYALALHSTPFPDYNRPTPEECNEVHRLLVGLHGEMKPPVKIPEPSLIVAGCGLVPSVLDAVIRTLLSSATNNRNSSAAVQGLAQRFGVLKEGVGKGSIDWDAVRVAPVEDIFEAIKVGGLANNKSKNIKQLLSMVYEENQQRRASLLSSKDDPAGADRESKDAKNTEITKAEKHVLSLDYLHLLPDQELLEHLVRYPGVAHKTAKCVAMFCMGREVFPVDTHVFRITKWLGWFPEGENNNAKAQAHMEVRVPDELKYTLHRLFIAHGRQCPRCIAGNHPGSKGWDDGCVIEHLVKRTGKNAGGGGHEAEEIVVIGKERKRGKADRRKGKRKSYEESEASEADSEPIDDEDYED